MIAVFSSFMFVYSRTLQRTADDLVKIRGTALEERFQDCVKWTSADKIQDCNKIRDLQIK